MGYKKLWHDDIRVPPDDSWFWARTNIEAIKALIENDIEECSLDHDLGLHKQDPSIPGANLQIGQDKENNGQKLVTAMLALNLVPEKITVHSWNYDGAKYMEESFRRAGYNVEVKPYDYS